MAWEYENEEAKTEGEAAPATEAESVAAAAEVETVTGADMGKVEAAAAFAQVHSFAQRPSFYDQHNGVWRQPMVTFAQQEPSAEDAMTKEDGEAAAAE